MARSKRPQGRSKPPPRLDTYEAEEDVPDEEKHAGQRYDVVDNYEYELPSDFEDEEIDEDAAFTEEDKKLYAGWFEGTEAALAGKGKADIGDGLLDSDDDEGGADDEGYNTDDFSAEEDAMPEEPEGEQPPSGGSDGDADIEDDEDGAGEEHHQRMLEDIRAAGRPASSRVAKQVQTESVPESALNVGPMTDLPGGGQGELQISDLLGALGRGPGRGGLDARARKTLERLEKRSAPVEPALPATIRARKQRQAGYEVTKKDVSKWQAIVKANREAPTLKFASGNEDVPRTSTTGALTAKFEPARDFEKEIAAMLEAAGAHNEQAVQEAEEVLALKAQTVEEAKRRRDHLAKMRSLLFHQEMKLKHLAKIKSKDYHRRAQKAARAKAKKAGEMGDAEFLRLAAEEAEFKRVKERLTLKHKNTSQWARRALRRGINVMDEGTRDAIQEQLRLGQELRRKVEAPGSASGDYSHGDDSATDASDEEDGAQEDLSKPSRKAVAKAKAAAMDILQSGNGEEEAPAKGLFALPFMRRAQEKRRAVAQAEAAAMLRDMEAADARAEHASDDEAADWAASEPAGGHGGRLRFGNGSTVQQDLESDEGVSEADASDADEDAEAKAERLGLYQAFRDDVQPASASRAAAGFPQAAGQKRASPANAEGRNGKSKREYQLNDLMNGSTVKQKSSKKKRKAARQLDAMSNGSASRQMESQPEATAADLHNSAQGEGYEPYRRDVLADVARKQREHLLGTKIGVLTQNGGAHDGQKKGKNTAALAAAAQQNGDSSAAAAAGFIPADTFEGLRAGYAFKAGPQGTGYYRDRHSEAKQQSTSSAPEAPAKPVRQAAQPQQDMGNQEDEGIMKPLEGTELSQRELIARAFAGDDVQAEFEEAKGREAEEEAPKVDALSLLPGWGAWAGQHCTPGWMAKAQDKAQRQRQEAIAKRKDAKLAHVVISERYDKKAARYGTPSVPFPFGAKDVYERSMRQPLGREFNTDSSFRNLTRPKILKTPGVIIEPQKYKEASAREAASMPGHNAKRKSIAVVSNGMRKQSKK